MFVLAIFLGLFSYIIFFLGIAGFLYKDTVIAITIFYSLSSLFYFRKSIHRTLYTFIDTWKRKTISIKKLKLEFFLLFILIIQAIVNLIGVLGPELAYDALWYHLTLPKMFLLEKKIYFIPGGLFYYSVMPKLTEMFYLTGLIFQGEILAKFIHFTFGILSLGALYMFARKYFTVSTSLLICLLFYSNLVVAWESITAYVDLARTFYEILAVFALICWIHGEERKWLYLSAVMIGFAMNVKLIAVSSFIIYLLIISFILYKKKSTFLKCLTVITSYILIAMFCILPWLLFSYFSTGNPIYPIFSGYPIGYHKNLLSPIHFISDIFKVFLFADDPSSPIYLICLPLLLFYFKKIRKEFKIISAISLLSIMFWYFTPRTGGGRFLMPYLPLYSLLVGEVILNLQKNKLLRQQIIIVVIFTACITIGYRFIANSKYISYIIGKESRSEFLHKHLNFSFGDFHDIDGYFLKTIKRDDKVLLFGFHNLYYIDFPFVDSSWVRKGDLFNYIATQNTLLPDRFRTWKLVYENEQTGVKLYSQGKKFFLY